MPITRRGDVFEGRTRPGRTFVERSRSSLVFRRCRGKDRMAEVRPHLRCRRIAWFVFNPKLGRVVGIRLAASSEFRRGREIDLFVILVARIAPRQAGSREPLGGRRGRT